MYRYNTDNKSGSGLFGGARGKPTAGAFSRALDVAFGWLDRARQRRHLAELDDRLLRDIGISRAEVEVELSRPLWRSID